MLWIVLFAFGIPLVYIVSEHLNQKRDREIALRRIRKRLAEKEQSNHEEVPLE